MIDRRRTKALRDAIANNRLGRSWMSLLTNATIAELREELNLIDKTAKALIRLSRLRQASR
jgi:hypothetical protein